MNIHEAIDEYLEEREAQIREEIEREFYGDIAADDELWADMEMEIKRLTAILESYGIDPATGIDQKPLFTPNWKKDLMRIPE